MAKFTSGDLRLKDGQKVTFGTSLDSNLWWDGSDNDVRLDTTISGVNPIQDYHLTTKWYVDDEIATLSGGVGYLEKNGTVLKPKTADDTVEIPLSAGGKIELGSLDPYSRPQIWNYLTDSVLRLGSSQAEGDATDVESEGWVIYGENLEGDPMAVADFGYARAKPDRFGLYNSKDGVYAGYLFRIDLSSNDCYLRDNTGVKTLQFDRLTGELIINGDITASGTRLSECVLIDGTRGFTSTVSGVDPTLDYHLATKSYVDTAVGVSGAIDHGNLQGLGDDDHSQYILVDGTRAFTGVVGGITPTAANHLTTKQYVDNAVYGLDWKESVLDIVPIASGVQSTDNRYIASATGGGWTINQIYEWDGSQWVNDPVDEGAAAWVEDEDGVYVFNGTAWVKFGSTVTHNNLSGLQGGQASEYYHLTSTMYTALTTVGGVGDASIQHIHDGRYYTESEITTISGDILAQLEANIVTVGSSGADYDNFDDAIDYLRVLSGGTIVITSDMTISGNTKDVSNIHFVGNTYYAGTRKLNKTASTGHWYGNNVEFTDIQFYRMMDGVAGGTIIFKFTEDWQRVQLVSVTCVGISSLSSPPVFDCNSKEAHIVAELSALGIGDVGGAFYEASSNYSGQVTHLYNGSYIYITGLTDKIEYDASGVIEGSPTYSTSNQPVLVDKASAVENDSTVSGVTVKDALENLDLAIASISGSGSVDHGDLTGLDGDDHTQYVLADGSRGFTSTVSGVDPTSSYHLATKDYVDTLTISGGIDRHGRQAVANGASTVIVNFADLGHTNYTVNVTLENTTDSPPSIYAFIVSAKNSNGFTVTFIGTVDSANYALNWAVIED